MPRDADARELRQQPGLRPWDPRGWDLRGWAGFSAGLHALLLLAVLLDLAARRFEEPEERAIAVELVAALPPQQAQGERPAQTPGPPTAVPPPPRPEPPTAEARPTPAMPLPPPPPPPPAPAPAAAPRAEPAPRPLPPPPAPMPDPAPRPQQTAQAPAPPTPPTQAAAPPRPAPPTPAPPSATPPPPQPSQQAGTGQTPPPPRPQERSQSVLNTLERLRQEQRQTEAPRARPTPPTGAPQPTGGAPTGSAALTAGDIRGLAEQVGECWAVDRGAPDLAGIVVELRVQLDGTGVVRNVVPASGVPSDPRARAVYESARRALLAPACNPLRVPPAKYATLMASTFRFNPRGLVP